ncbi:MAG: dethiobiotin synthase [Sterolibacterium sp.]|nr:dethiobiotin synthase [Sterolibacterium sp.]
MKLAPSSLPALPALPALQFGCFVTGTDTDVGKTLIAAALLRLCVARGWRSVGMKPVAAGGTQDEQGAWRNVDVEQLLAAGNLPVTADDINPYRYREAIAPHLAAAHEGRPIEASVLLASYQQLRQQAEALVVEGAGGFMVPLANDVNGDDAGSHYGLDDFAAALQLPVILVVGMRLGCLNHALLTQAAIQARGLKLAGWVANRVTPQMSCFEENLATLQSRLQAPLLGVVPHLSVRHGMADAAAACLRLPLSGKQGG